MDIVGGKLATLPEGFVERTKDRGLIIKWVSHLKVSPFRRRVRYSQHMGLLLVPLGTPAIAEGRSIVPTPVVAPMVSYYRCLLSMVLQQTKIEINLADVAEQ